MSPWRSASHLYGLFFNILLFTELWPFGAYCAAQNWLAQKSSVKPLSHVTDPFRLTAPVEVWNVPGNQHRCAPKIASRVPDDLSALSLILVACPSPYFLILSMTKSETKAITRCSKCVSAASKCGLACTPRSIEVSVGDSQACRNSKDPLKMPIRFAATYQCLRKKLKRLKRLKRGDRNDDDKIWQMMSKFRKESALGHGHCTVHRHSAGACLEGPGTWRWQQYSRISNRSLHGHLPAVADAQIDKPL